MVDTNFDVTNRSINEGFGSTSGGGGFGDVGGAGNTIPPPKNLTVGTAANFTQFIITFTSSDAVANARNKAAWYRLYYLDATEASKNEVSVFDPNNGPPFQPWHFGKRHWVQDVTVSASTMTTLVLSAGPYSHGGWFYATGVNAAGQEGFQLTNPAPIPISLTYSSPNREITNQLAPYSVSTINLLKYATFAFTWKTATGTVTTPTRYVQIFIGNYDDRGLLWEGPIFNCAPVGGASNTGSYIMACDDGTGGFPNPGAHTVTLYFVSLSDSYSHRPDPTSAPSVVLATGVHS